MRRILPLSLLLIGCPSPSEPPPPLPPPPTDGPPPPVQVEVCEQDPASLPFAVSWKPVVLPPEPIMGVTQTYTGTVSIPVSLGLALDDVRVFGTAATLTDQVDDGTTLSATYWADASCEGACGWVELTIHDGPDVLLLQAPTAESVSLESTALMALDVSRAEAPARVGASGLLPGMRPDLDAAVPTVVDRLVAAWENDRRLPILPGGAPEPGTAVFDAVEQALAGPLHMPALAALSDRWMLFNLTPPAGARLVVWAGSAVSVPIEAGEDGRLSFVFPAAATAPETLVFRYLAEDGSQSPATIVTRGPQEAVSTAFTVEATEGDAVQVRGLTPGDWVAVQGRWGGSACVANDAGEAVLSVDPTSDFVVLEVDDALQVRGFLACTWMAGVPSCS